MNNVDPFTIFWLLVALICFLTSGYLLGFAIGRWRANHAAAKAQAEFEAEYPCPKCRDGLTELANFTCDGAWTCPRCGRPHLLADGRPTNGVDTWA